MRMQTKAERIPADQVAQLKSAIPMAAVVANSLKLFRAGGGGFLALCPYHNERRPSFHIYADHAYCFGCGKKIDAIEWLMERESMSFVGAVRHLGELAGRPLPEGLQAERQVKDYGLTATLPCPDYAPQIVAKRTTPRIFNPKTGELKDYRPDFVFDYRDQRGRLLHHVIRCNFTGRKFVTCVSWCQGNGFEGWTLVSPPAPRSLYRMENLAARPGAVVVLVEGEKTCDAAQQLLPHMVALSWLGGGQAYKLTDWSVLAGRTVVCIPDADTAGRETFSGKDKDGRHAPGIVELLREIGAKTYLVNPPPDCVEGWDLADAKGWDTASTLAWIKANLAGQ